MRLLSTLLVLLLATPGLTQPISPRVMVIFDTSGSMLWNPAGEVDCQGDGSPGHEHRGCPDGSRLFFAKGALSNIVENSEGVEFGLLRYGQLEPGDAGFNTTHAGARYRDANGAEITINYDGSTNGCGPADLLVEPGPMSNDAVLGWMDGREDYPADKELRADGFTPLTASMDSASGALTEILSNDPLVECRPYYILLLTDGYQQCPDGDANDPAYRDRVRAQLVDQANELRQLGIMGAQYDVRTFVVGFGSGTAFATELDDVARAGGTAINAAGDLDLVNGTAYQADDADDLSRVLADAVDNARIRELCDGLDNDCDDAIDEDFARLGDPCDDGIGACGRDGQLVCSGDGEGLVCTAQPGDPRPEECNGIDDDCDGQVDEGTLNRCGGCGVEPAEVCNGEDDDCDGVADEGVLNACDRCGPLPQELCDGDDQDCDGRVDEGTLNNCGECGPEPPEVCDCLDNDCDDQIDEHSDQCPICDCEPTPEVCNNQDDDCDRRVDENVRNACGECGELPLEVCNGLDDDCDGRPDENPSDVGGACGMDEGICEAGVLRCLDGRLVCDGEVGPTVEICDALDNDCDARVDEGSYNACGYCGPTRIETCDNIDNDCNGQVDEGEGLCRAADACRNGECADPCQVNECFGGRVCVDGHCLTPCRTADCPSGWVCQDGRCSDPCVGIPCPESTYCSLGRCLPADCHGPDGCPDGEICRDLACVPDLCLEAGCRPDQGCRDGVCFDDCPPNGCAEGLLCIDGQCSEAPCARVTCPFPRVCRDGECVDDPCEDVRCNRGFLCIEGECVEDPCVGVVCPPGATCDEGRCVADMVSSGIDGNGSGFGADGGVSAGAPVAEGCNCDAQGGSSNAPLWALIFLGFLRSRRTRR